MYYKELMLYLVYHVETYQASMFKCFRYFLYQIRYYNKLRSNREFGYISPTFNITMSYAFMDSLSDFNIHYSYAYHVPLSAKE